MTASAAAVLPVLVATKVIVSGPVSAPLVSLAVTDTVGGATLSLSAIVAVWDDGAPTV